MKIVSFSVLAALICAPILAQPYTSVPGVGWEGQGAGVDYVNLDSNPRPEMILMAYDNPAGSNTFRYKVGWNVWPSSGIADSWSNTVIVNGVGWEAQGADLIVGQIDSNPRPDMVFMAYDNPSGGNTYRYKIGWNVWSSGIADSWSNTTIIPGSGWEGQGAGIELANIDNDPRPELILMAYDNPTGSNNIRIKIGWNLNSNGQTSNWTNQTQLPGMGWEGQGASLAIGQLGGNSRPDMVLAVYDGFPNSGKTFRYRIGWDMNTNGVPASWSNEPILAGFGSNGQGAGLAIHNVTGGPTDDLIFMAYNAPAGGNDFRYAINPTPRMRILLELDRTSNASWPPNLATPASGPAQSLAGIYNAFSVDLDILEDGTHTNLAGTNFSDAELDAFRNATMNQTPGPGQWHIHGSVLHRYVVPEVDSIMFDDNGHQSFAVFDDANFQDGLYLRATAHGLGHALNLEHSDAEAHNQIVFSPFPPFTQLLVVPGRDVMSPGFALTGDWGYFFSDKSRDHLFYHQLFRLEPGGSVPFGECH